MKIRRSKQANRGYFFVHFSIHLSMIFILKCFFFFSWSAKICENDINSIIFEYMRASTSHQRVQSNITPKIGMSRCLIQLTLGHHIFDINCHITTYFPISVWQKGRFCPFNPGSVLISCDVNFRRFCSQRKKICRLRKYVHLRHSKSYKISVHLLQFFCRINFLACDSLFFIFFSLFQLQLILAIYNSLSLCKIDNRLSFIGSNQYFSLFQLQLIFVICCKN